MRNAAYQDGRVLRETRKRSSTVMRALSDCGPHAT